MKNYLVIIFFLMCFLPSPVVAEVIDKELSINGIWILALSGSIIGLLLIFFRRWLGIFSLIIFGFFLYGTISEWNDPFVGSAIAVEIGPNYGVHAYSAFALLLVSHLVSWVMFIVKDRNRFNDTRTNR